ncbi:MAG TPA: beta-galactosidase [Kiritimatiellia bacterium]|nr:beta-galactosidase [Kiritimatiellia bacterium]
MSKASSGIRTALFLFFLCVAGAASAAPFIQMKDGYFFDPVTGKPWVPHGIAYQTWNRPLGVWQTKEQVDYDLDEMVKMGANSIRVDFVWQHIEENGDNQWKWSNYDYLVEAAEARGIKIFALIGYQWPPNWFPDEWYTMHPPEIDAEGIPHTNRWQSDIINYEHPQARAQYAEWISTVCARYKNAKSIVAWIVGNEYGYLGLWSGLLDGYDPQTEQAFRNWCSNKYATVEAVNQAWGLYGQPGVADSTGNVAATAQIGGRLMVLSKQDNLPAGDSLDLSVNSELDGSGTWTSRLVRFENNISAISLAEIAGRPALAYDNDFGAGGYGELRYGICSATNGQGTWSYRIVSTQRMSYYPGLYATLSQLMGKPVIVAVDKYSSGPITTYRLCTYFADATDGLGGWTTNVIDAGSSSWICNGNMVLLNGHPAVAYLNGTNLYLAVNDSTNGTGAWVRSSIPAAAPCGKPSLSIVNGKLSVAYPSGTAIDADLVVAANSAADGSGTWTSSTVDTGRTYGASLRDIGGKPAVLYQEFDSSQIRYAVQTASNGWKKHALATGGTMETSLQPLSEAAAAIYIRSNAVWSVSLPAAAKIINNFSDISFVEQYRAYGPDGAEWADMTQFREDSIADFTALSAQAAKSADTNHLISYSTVGMQWGEEDWRYHAEDRGKITAFAAARGAPIDFFSVNNYPWSVLGHEAQNGQWGISYTKKVAGIPVLYSETGFTSSETMWPGMTEARQGPLVRNALWESLEAGAIGTHIFAWHDRPYITDREKGFGILYANRAIKPAFWVSRNTFLLMDQAKMQSLLAGSKDPKPDVAFLWTAAADSQYNRYECEMQQVAGALERLGYEPNFMNLQDLASGAYTNFRAIILPRNMRVDAVVPGYTNSVLNFLLTRVLPAGVHVMATADLPGMQDFNGKPRADFEKEVAQLFGIDASDAGGYEMPQRRRNYVSWYWNLIEVDFNSNAVGAVAGNYHYWPFVWKYSDEIKVTDGTVWATMNTLRNKGFEDSNTSASRWDGTWGNVFVRSGWGWAYEGNNMVQMWGDSGMYKDFPVVPHGRYTHSAYLRSNSDDPLRGGKEAWVAIEWMDEQNNLIGVSESTHLTTNTPGNSWLLYKVDAHAPANAWTGRRVTRMRGPGDGAVFVDDDSRSPAVVVKNHGAAKAAIFLYSAGDMRPDGNLDGDPDIYDWRWRYDVFGATVRDYFGVKPALQALGTNAYLCLADYRTCSNGATLWQVKNYLYDTNQPNGGPPMTFTLSSSLFTGKTVRAIDQGLILAERAATNITLSLAPDGMEMLYVYPPKTNDIVVQLADAPAVVHPFGDKNYIVTLKYDTKGLSNVVLKVALMEDGDNGDGVPNEIIQQLTITVTGSGTTNLYIYIPDPDLTDTDLISTADGGKWKFQVWAETSGGQIIGDTVSQTTQLKWGVKPTGTIPSVVTKGSTVQMPVEWQELYEYLSWQNTPMTRNDAFPGRVALFRSTKTEKRYPGHLATANRVADWLESLGYSAGNPLDISFDNVTVSLNTDSSAGPTVAFTDSAEGGTNGWTATGLWHQDTAQAASPTRSWTYNNGVNYNTGARNTGTLTTPWISLSNAAAATLTFKSWYETEDTGTSWDKKLVQVSTDGTNWTQVLQISGPNKQWTSQTADLSPYAGKRVQVRFVFDSIDGVYNTFAGWAVDDVTVLAVQGAPRDLFFDSMESTTNWTGSGLWRLATNRASGGIRSWVYNNGTNYNNGARNSGSIISRWIDLADAESAALTFKSWYRTEDTGTSWDRKTVLVSTDGTNWTQLLQISGVASDWTTQTADLTPYAGRRIQLRFFFDTIDALNNQYEGWYVDEVRVSCVSGIGASILNDHVETGTNGWSAAGLWHVADDMSATPSHSWAYNNGSNYNTGARNNGALLSPWIDLIGAESAKLTFQSWYETEDTSTAWDRKTVSISTDGTNWTQILQVSGANKVWVGQAADLSAYAGQRIRLRFFFDTIDGVYNQFRGWYVDDIRVSVVGSGLLMVDGFSQPALSTNWTRAAGAANWAVSNGALRVWRIGNSDNILTAGQVAWSNYTLSADIRYNTQDEYFNDAELYLRYIDRDNFVKVGIRNYYGFWRLKYTVRDHTNIVAQGWLHEFSKTNRPVENTWYSLKVTAASNAYTVYFNGEDAGSFTATNFAAGRVGMGTMAAQLGIWEPQNGYFFVDDDEYSFWAPEGQPTGGGKPLNLDWGYLNNFYTTLILPGAYVMSDVEVSNIVTWLDKGMYSLISTDGGAAMEKENGVSAMGRIEPLFGAAPSLTTLSGLTRLTVGTNDHYVTLDHTAGAQIPATGSARAWSGLTKGTALGRVDNGVSSAPALIVNTLTNDPYAPRKTLCFNFGIDAASQMTGSFSNIARRAFEWSRGQAHKVRVLLKYPVHADQPEYDITLAQWDAWVLSCNGSNTLALNIPTEGIMTGSNLYWVIYTYAWDAEEAWAGHDGFYTSQNDGGGLFTSIPGIGLQVLGASDKVYGGRTWDLWLGYNTTGQSLMLTYGIKDKGGLRNEDNFDDGNYAGWTIQPSPNYRWTVTNGAVRYTSPTNGGLSWLMRDGLNVADRNITIEYDVKYSGGAEGGGLIYRGQILQLHPWGVYWTTNNPLDMSSGTASNFSGLVTNADGSVSYVITGSVSVHIGAPYFTTGSWHHVMVSIRDGDPCPVSDVSIDGKAILFMEPLKHTNWSGTSVGFLSPEKSGQVEWDNFRVVDEQYSAVTQMVTGVYVPTNAVTPFWPYVPDYDPDMWEYEGTQLGGQYEWYAYFRGKNEQSTLTAALYFAPRLMVEDTNFPTVITAGQTVQLPVEWESLPQAPMKLRVQLVDPYSGSTPVTQDFTVNTLSGSAYFPITVPSNAPSSGNFLWSAFIYPDGSASPFDDRIGLDDTYRFNTLGQPIGPETQITVIGTPLSDNDEVVLYSDSGLLGGCSVYTWQGGTATFDGDYTGIAAPEGVKSFRTYGNYWQGWGLFSAEGGVPDGRDMRAFTNGFVKFWANSTVTLKVQLEDTGYVKRTKYVPSTGGVWKEIVIPISDFSGVNLSSIYGLIEISSETASTFYIDNVRWVKGIFRIYRDAGIPAGCDVITWAGGTSSFNGDFVDAAAPEGIKTFRTEGSSWIGWGVAKTNGTLDLGFYSNGVVYFWAKSTNALKIEIEAPQGTKRTKYISSTGGSWQEFVLPMSEFSGVNFSQVYAPFTVSADVGATFFVDDVRWIRSTNDVSTQPHVVVYSDAGIPMGSDVYVWWASQYWDHVSLLMGDGSFEFDAQGRFPDSGFWAMTSAGGTATGQCLAAAVRTGFSGLRLSTATQTTSTWVSTYQELTAYAGDIYHLETYVRQPGSSWIAGSLAYPRLQFLDAGRQVITNIATVTKVTSAGQAWTLCSLPDTVAPYGTRYVRLDLVVQKPAGQSGISLADFDDARLSQGNSFYGEFAEDPAPPEGAKTFRSYCVNWSGWGIFYTNATVNYSSYSNGYLKFWLKSSGYTKIELQSQTGTNLQTVTGAYYNPTTDGNGQIIWQHKVIPITNFTGVVLTNIKSPFMATDPTFDRSYSIDNVRWEMTP